LSINAISFLKFDDVQVFKFIAAAQFMRSRNLNIRIGIPLEPWRVHGQSKLIDLPKKYAVRIKLLFGRFDRSLFTRHTLLNMIKLLSINTRSNIHCVLCYPARASISNYGHTKNWPKSQFPDLWYKNCFYFQPTVSNTIRLWGRYNKI